MYKKALPFILFTAQVFAGMQGSEASNASADLSSQGLAQITQGSMHILTAGSMLPIVALNTVGDMTYITLKAVHQSTTVTLSVASSAVNNTLIGAGQFVKVVATGLGVILTTSGQVIAFIPNEIGKSMIYSEAL